MSYHQFFEVATPGVILGMLTGGIAVLCLVTLLIAVIETVVLTILGWGDFRKSLAISIIMNIASGIVGGFLLVIFPQPSIESLVIAMIITILIEWGVMSRFQVNRTLLTLFAVLLANLISYAIIIFPAFFYSQT